MSGDTLVAADSAITEQAPKVEAEGCTKTKSAADSLAAALKGTDKATDATANANLEQIKKEHPLAAILQFNTSGQSPIVGYAHYKDTAEINKYFAIPSRA